MFEKLKQYKDLRKQAKQIQNTLAQETVHASALSGQLNIIMDGNQKVLSVEVAPELLNPDKKKYLEDGLKDLYDNASSALQKLMAQKMRSGDLKMPDMSNLGM
ncbi:MAG: YbaB/EbfC family nucleoid-associated protein, partial [Patescibacteria group bacterium]|jgi:DNA-binding protein YbaB